MTTKNCALVIVLLSFLISAPVWAWDENNPVVEPTQRTDAPFRLFRTSNVYNFLKLDTRTGQVWQLQWSDKTSERSVNIINATPLAEGKAGRFTLYPSSNVFTFILLDQEDGRQWQTQWGFTRNDRFIVEISPQTDTASENGNVIQQMQLPDLHQPK